MDNAFSTESSTTEKLLWGWITLTDTITDFYIRIIGPLPNLPWLLPFVPSPNFPQSAYILIFLNLDHLRTTSVFLGGSIFHDPSISCCWNLSLSGICIWSLSFSAGFELKPPQLSGSLPNSLQWKHTQSPVPKGRGPDYIHPCTILGPCMGHSLRWRVWALCLWAMRRHSVVLNLPLTQKWNLVFLLFKIVSVFLPSIPPQDTGPTFLELCHDWLHLLEFIFPYLRNSQLWLIPDNVSK